MFLLPATLVVMLTLSGCSLLSAAGKLVSGMAKAITRTVTDANTPSDKPAADPVEVRGAEIAARGAYGGAINRENPAAAVGVASR